MILKQQSFSMDSVNSQRRLKLTVHDFVLAGPIDSGDSPKDYSVFVEVQGSGQIYSTSQKIASDADQGRTVFDETKEFAPFDGDDIALSISLQDQEQEDIGAPQEVNLTKLIDEQYITVTIKDGEKQKLGDLKLSGEWLKIE